MQRIKQGTTILASLLIICLILGFFPVSVFADDLSGSEGEATEEEIKVLTLAEAVQQAIDFNRKMIDNELTIRQLEDIRERTAQRVMSDTYSYEPGSLLEAASKQRLLSLMQTDIDLDLLKRQQDIEEESIANTVKQLFFEIQELNTEMEVMRQNLQLENNKYRIDQIKHQLGLVSSFQVNQSRLGLDAFNQRMEAVDRQLAEAWNRLSFLLGEKDLSEYTLEEIERLEEDFTLGNVETVILRRVNSDPYVQMQERLIEKAELNLRLYTYTDTGESYEMRRLGLEKEKNQLKNIKENLREVIISRHKMLEGLLKQREALLTEMEQMENQLKNLELFLQAGMITRIEVEEAAAGFGQLGLGLKRLENQIEQLKDLFEKPYLAPQYLQ